MARMGFELAVSVFERAKTFHAPDRAATVIGQLRTNYNKRHIIVKIRYIYSKKKKLFFHSGVTAGFDKMITGVQDTKS
jgi:hypothetical protein